MTYHVRLIIPLRLLWHDTKSAEVWLLFKRDWRVRESGRKANAVVLVLHVRHVDARRSKLHVSYGSTTRIRAHTGLNGSDPGLIICEPGDILPLCLATGVRGDPLRFGLPVLIAWLKGIFCGDKREECPLLAAIGAYIICCCPCDMPRFCGYAPCGELLLPYPPKPAPRAG